MAARPIFLGSIVNFVAKIVNGDSTNKVTVYAAGGSGVRLYALGVSSTDTSNRDINIYATISGTDYLLATVQIPLNSGNANNVASVDLIGSTMLPWVRSDEAGRKYIDLANGTTLKAAAVVAVTAGKEIAFFGMAGSV